MSNVENVELPGALFSPTCMPFPFDLTKKKNNGEGFEKESLKVHTCRG